MSILGTFWHKICEPLDGFLWHRGITHPIIRPLLRSQILATGACILIGGFCFAVFSQIFWFGCGILCMTWIFWSWAHFFLRVDIGQYSAAFLRAILIRFFGRLTILAMLLYLALAYANASAPAILVGMITGAFLALASYAFQFLRGGRRRPTS